MMKKILAAAIVSAFAAPAFAATANVDISGKMAWDVTKASGTGTAAENTTHLNDNNSRFAFKGSEDLGGGMKAGFSATLGFANTSGGATTAQDTFVFVSGGWGEVRAGVHDNLVKGIGRTVDLFADQSTGDARHLTNLGGIDGRGNNVVAYLSPKFSGFQVAVGQVMDETATANTGATTNMATVTYQNGPLYVGLGYDTRNYANDQKDLRLGVAYNLGDLRLTGLYQKADTLGGVNNDDVKVWGVGAGYKMGAMTFKGQYYTLDDKVATDDSKMYALGVDYALSKRTVAQLAYSKVKNDTGVNYGGAAAVGSSDAITIANGADPSRISVGVVHNF